MSQLVLQTTITALVVVILLRSALVLIHRTLTPMLNFYDVSDVQVAPKTTKLYSTFGCVKGMCYEGCIWTTHSHDSHPDGTTILRRCFFRLPVRKCGNGSRKNEY